MAGCVAAQSQSFSAAVWPVKLWPFPVNRSASDNQRSVEGQGRGGSRVHGSGGRDRRERQKLAAGEQRLYVPRQNRSTKSR